MRLKYLWFTVLISIFFIPVIGQDFYTTQWTQKGTTYSGLLIYYGENDALMRVNFDYNGQNHIAEFKCKGEYFKRSEYSKYSGYLLNGFSAKMIQGDLSLTYIPDNFIFVAKEGENALPYVLDDNDLEIHYGDILKVSKWEKIEISSFSVPFVKKYFTVEEELYKSALALNSKQQLEGYRISTQAYGKDSWVVAMSKGTDYTTQVSQASPQYPKKWVISKWQEGLDVTSASYGKGEWEVTMSKGTGYLAQQWRINSFLEFDWFEQKWSENYAITSLAYGNGAWITIVSQGTPYIYQEVKTSENYPQEWVNHKWKKGFSITSVVYGGGKWAVVMSKGANYGLQMWKTSQEFPKDWINKKWKKNYYITSIAYGQGLWCVIMSQKSNYITQIWNKTQDYPQSWIKSKWEEPQHQNSDGNNLRHFTNAKMHLVVVANTQVPDIGTSCSIDQHRAEHEFEVICKELNIELNKVIINDYNLDKENVTQAIENLKPAPNDIIAFVYTGHGYRTKDQRSRYPRISFRLASDEPVDETTSYELEEIYDEIASKGARLTFVIGDCCNADSGRTMRDGGVSMITSNNQLKGKVSRLKKLFLDSRGSMIVTAARPNETSCGNLKDGGYFILSFFQSLYKETSYLSSSELPRWDNIVQNAIDATTYKSESLNGCQKQNGIYQSTIR